MLKTLEYLGRNLLLKLLNRRQLKAAPSFSSPSSILVIRTDPRVGNVIMLTAFLKEIQLAYPKARLTLLGPAKAKTLLEGSPMLTSLWCFNKKHFVGDDGWFQTLKRLKRHKFELIIDASNPTSPSTTQTILSLLGNAPHKLGFGNESAKSAYTLTAQPLSADEHENLQRV